MKSTTSKLESNDSRSDCETNGTVVEACQHGDRNAQCRLYEQYGARVFGLMLRMVDRQDAADLTQQVFLQVYRKIHLFSGKSQFGTWLYRVAINEALQHLRRERSRPSRRLEFDPIDHRGHIDSYDQRESLGRALSQIEPSLRAIFLLREVEQLSYAELATSLEISPGTVASRLNRARRELRKEITRVDNN